MSEKRDVELEEALGAAVATEQLSPREEKRILRRIDTCLLPIMAVSYMFQYLDKTALSFTAIMGLRDDLHLSGSNFSWASSMYYFGYLVASYPVGMLMVRWQVGKTIALSIFVWGGVLLATAGCRNAKGLLAVRFFLGVTESAIAPGLSVVVSMWYKRSEQPLRHAAWFIGNTFAGILGGLLAYAIGHIQSIPPWQAVFFIFGGLTIAWSLCILLLMPDTPMQAWFLNEEDCAKAIVRVKDNMTGIKSNEFKWSQCIEALMDVKTWLLAAVMICINIPNGALSSFGAIVIEGLGFNRFHSLLLQGASYFLQLFAVLSSTGGSSYLANTRTYWLAWNFSLAIVGASLLRQLPDHLLWGRYAGKCLTTAAAANFPLLMSLSSGNVGGFTKKTTVNAVVFIIYCTGNIIGPQLFIEREAPSYNSGFLAIMICYGVGIAFSFTLRFYLAHENRRRDRDSSVQDTQDSTELDGNAAAMLDKTDMEISQFRYVY
ncbi:vitamin H transporter [Dactylonectria estremocensis]|uniref:Vitamin H transporter n=1 Tax=Dactylonectria estremocensis TaxID=1079267 RepID=A0A9P9EIU6_9HYPO|nr:vitamin H transporter [Dactylonectria estremocensis]